VSKFHLIWYIVVQESKLERNIQILGSFWVNRTYPSRLSDKSGVQFYSTRHIRHFYRTSPESGSVQPDLFGTSIEQIQRLVLFDRTNPAILPDKSSETGQIQFKAGHVHRTILAATFDDCFRRNLLTVSLIISILLSLAS
jgi:hypothetical protein